MPISIPYATFLILTNQTKNIGEQESCHVQRPSCLLSPTATMTLLSVFAELNSSLPPIPLRGIAIVLLVSLILKLRNVGARDKDMPPGPHMTLILGNALDFPTSFPHIKYVLIFAKRVFELTVLGFWNGLDSMAISFHLRYLIVL